MTNRVLGRQELNKRLSQSSLPPAPSTKKTLLLWWRCPTHYRDLHLQLEACLKQLFTPNSSYFILHIVQSLSYSPCFLYLLAFLADFTLIQPILYNSPEQFSLACCKDIFLILWTWNFSNDWVNLELTLFPVCINVITWHNKSIIVHSSLWDHHLLPALGVSWLSHSLKNSDDITQNSSFFCRSQFHLSPSLQSPSTKDNTALVFNKFYIPIAFE